MAREHGDDGVYQLARAGDADGRPGAADRPHLGKPGEQRVGHRRGRPEADRRRGRGGAGQRGRGVEGDDPAGVENGDPVAEPLGLLQQVGDQQDGDAAVADPFDEVPVNRAAITRRTTADPPINHPVDGAPCAATAAGPG
jgi:hypothetical protein